MSPTLHENLRPNKAIIRDAKRPVLRLLVRNHPGVMSHVCGLFARRAFNMEAILCLPVEDGEKSVILLEQVIRQLEKLEDVLEITQEEDGHEAFETMAEYLAAR
jgi:acetolactate synthase-1/3 small subunit